MRPVPMFDANTPLKDICSREDFNHKKSLRNSMAPTFVPDAGKHGPVGMGIGRVRRKYNKEAPKLTELEIAIKNLRDEHRAKEMRAREERLIGLEDKFARVVNNKHPQPCVQDMAQQKLFFAADERNKLAEINYLLHRKDEEDSRHSGPSRPGQNAFSSPAYSHGKKQPREGSTDVKSPRHEDGSNRSKSRGRGGSDRSTLPFAMANSSKDEIILEAGEDEDESGKVETIDYEVTRQADDPSDMDSIPKKELLALIELMEVEIVDLKKDLEDAKADKSHSEPHAGVPRSFLEKLKSFLIRNQWNFSELSKDVSEKDAKISQLLDLISRFDPSLAKQISRADSTMVNKLGERILENGQMIEEVKRIGDKTEWMDMIRRTDGGMWNRDDEIARYEDQIGIMKEQIRLQEEFIRKVISRMPESVQQANAKKVDNIVEKGPAFSVEYLMVCLERAEQDKIQAELRSKSLTEDLANIGKRLAELQSIAEHERFLAQKDMQDVIDLLNFTSTTTTQKPQPLRSPSNPGTPTGQQSISNLLATSTGQQPGNIIGTGASNGQGVMMSPGELARIVRDKATALKVELDESQARLRVSLQKEEIKNAENKELRAKLISQNQALENITLEKSQLEERLKFSDIEKNNMQDMQFTAQDEIRRKLRAEQKKEEDSLNEQIKTLTAKVFEQVQAIDSLRRELDSRQTWPRIIGENSDPLTWVIGQLSEIITSDDKNLCSLDPSTKIRVIEVFGPEKGEMLLNYEKIISMFKVKCKLVEEIYKERLMRSQLSIRRTTNHLKALMEYVKACDQFDPCKPSTFAQIQKLPELKIKRSYISQLVDDLSDQLSRNQKIFSFGVDLDSVSPDRDHGTEEYLHETWADRDMSREGLRNLDNKKLFGILKDKQKENQELLGHLREDPEDRRKASENSDLLKSYQSFGPPTINIQQSSQVSSQPLPQSQLQQSAQMLAPPTRGPARFAAVQGYIEDPYHPIDRNSHRPDETLAITEDLDLYEKIRNDPKDLKQMLPPSEVPPQQNQIFNMLYMQAKAFESQLGSPKN